MPPLQQQNNAVLDALDEGKVSAVIALYRYFPLITPVCEDGSRRTDLIWILTNNNCGIGMSQENAEYWLDWFGVK